MAYGVSALCLSVDGTAALMEAPGVTDPVRVPIEELTAAAGGDPGELPGLRFECSLGRKADGAWHLFAFRRIPGGLEAGELRVRIHRHLRQHPDLTANEVARALGEGPNPVMRHLRAMEGDGEAAGTTEKRPGDSRPTKRWTAT